MLVICISEELLSSNGKEDTDKDDFISKVGNVEADSMIDIGIVFCIVCEVNDDIFLLVILVISKDVVGVDGTIWIVVVDDAGNAFVRFSVNIK